MIFTVACKPEKRVDNISGKMPPRGLRMGTERYMQAEHTPKETHRFRVENLPLKSKPID